MGLLVTASIWALFVAATLWFPFRRGPLGFATFLVTVTFNEIPLVLLLVFVVSVAASLGDAAAEGSGIFAAALGSSCVVAVGLVWLQLRARATRPALETALNAALGPGSFGSRRPELGASSSSAAAWRRGILLPFQRHSTSVTRVRNVRYAPGGRAHLLDIYMRKDADAGQDAATARRVLIHLHGGGFAHGGKSREGVAMLNRLAEHGWLCVSADYRLGSEGRFPQSLVDAKRVIAWVRANGVQLGADPDQIFVAGGSAGGHLAVSAALTACDPRFQPGFEESDTTVAGAVALYGYLGARGADPASSPARLARADAPPILIVHGARDTAVPPSGPRSVAAALRAVSDAPVVYAEVPNAQHSFDLFASVRARVVAAAVEDFLDWVTSTR